MRIRVCFYDQDENFLSSQTDTLKGVMMEIATFLKTHGTDPYMNGYQAMSGTIKFQPIRENGEADEAEVRRLPREACEGLLKEAQTTFGSDDAVEKLRELVHQNILDGVIDPVDLEDYLE